MKKAKAKRFYIYKLHWPNGEHKGCYIGQSKEGNQRYSAHKSSLSLGTHSNPHLQLAYNSTGILPSFKIIEYLRNPDFVWYIEAKHIKLNIDTCFNIMHGVKAQRPKPPLKSTDMRLRANRTDLKAK